jgi:uncharacterized protein YecT (DUF1311 family)
MWLLPETRVSNLRAYAWYPFKLLTAALLPLWFAVTASSAELDCSNPANLLDETLCTDAAAREKYQALDLALERASSQLSDAGRQSLLEGQDAWIALLNAACSTKSSFYDSPAECVVEWIENRGPQIETVVRRVGPYVLTQIYDFQYHLLENQKNNSRYPGLAYAEISFPQIDRQLTSAAVTWNQAMDVRAAAQDWISAPGENPDRPVDWAINATLTYVSPKLICTEVYVYQYAHGTAHGWTVDLYAKNYLLEEGRWLAVSDLFRPDSGWSEFLIGRIAEDKHKAGEYFDADGSAADILDPSHWVIRSEGLHVQWAAYIAHDLPKLIPWRDLAPYLAPNAPVPAP